MTRTKDPENSEFFRDGIDEETDLQKQPGQKISIWLAGSIIFFLLLVFVISALIVQRVYFQPPVIRTAVERELLKHKTAIKNNPNNAEAYVGLAGVYLEVEQPDKAIKELEKAIRLEPRSWNARFELGMAYEALGKPEEASSQFWKAAAIDPNNEYSFYQLGRLYHKKRDYGQAIQAYKKTLKVNATLADVHYYLGQCYEKTNKKSLAKQEYEEALKYVDSYPEAEKALKLLE
ncbi:MAG: tetratricopeptide repeat protein [Candidatus Aquicultor sp.]|nr:tetratricopeptide repeat protein [Candidatus Aquicultor sp.]